MLRRQFLTGAIAAASLAALPATASARKMRFIVLPGGNSDAANWFYGGLAGVVAVAAIVRGVFWVMSRLDENPGRPSYDLPPPIVPAANTSSAPVPASRKTVSAPRFGKRAG
ncbi:hypothetical protein [Rhizobium sp.]